MKYREELDDVPATELESEDRLGEVSSETGPMKPKRRYVADAGTMLDGI